jgi:HemY protein
MVGFLLCILLIATLVMGGRWLMAHPGDVVIHWFDYDITMHIAVVVALLLVLALFIALISITLWRLISWPKRRRTRRELRILQSGLRQLTLGVTALAMGDETSAQDALKKASLALPDDPLPQLLTAQLLQRQGKHEDARAQFKALMQHEVTAPLATRRLIEQHVHAREWLEATKLAEEAREEAPKDRWLVLTLLDLYARDGNSAAMLALSEGWQWQSPLSREERHRYAALAYYLAARIERDARKKEQALRHAVGYAPEFTPAVIDYATHLDAQGHTRRARKWLRAAWENAPSPVLIAPIIASIHSETPRAQLRLLRPFMKGTLTSAHHLLAAEQALEIDDVERAKEAVERALVLEESKAACTLMARIEKQQHHAESAARWLEKAVQAPQGETWVCDHCGELHAAWQAHCRACEHFDSLRYGRPEARITSVELTTAA